MGDLWDEVDAAVLEVLDFVVEVHAHDDLERGVHGVVERCLEAVRTKAGSGKSA